MLTADRIIEILDRTRRDYPRSWQHAHLDGDPERYDFIILSMRRLFDESQGQVGGNWRRAVIGDLSADGITVTVDNTRYFIDVIGKAKDHPNDPWEPYLQCNFDPNNILKDQAGRYAPHGFVNPYGEAGVYPPLRTHYAYGSVPVEPPTGGGGGGGGTTPTTPTGPGYITYRGDEYYAEAGRVLEQDYLEAGRVGLDGGAQTWLHRVFHDSTFGEAPGRVLTIQQAIAKHRPVWRSLLGL